MGFGKSNKGTGYSRQIVNGTSPFSNINLGRDLPPDSKYNVYKINEIKLGYEMPNYFSKRMATGKPSSYNNKPQNYYMLNLINGKSFSSNNLIGQENTNVCKNAITISCNDTCSIWSQNYTNAKVSNVNEIEYYGKTAIQNYNCCLLDPTGVCNYGTNCNDGCDGDRYNQLLYAPGTCLDKAWCT
jgi:hypothetical protein